MGGFFRKINIFIYIYICVYCMDSLDSSVKVVLTDYGCAGGGDITQQFDNLYDEIKTWCKANSVPLHMTGLTRTLLNFSRDSEYPTGPTEFESSQLFFVFERWLRFFRTFF